MNYHIDLDERWNEENYLASLDAMSDEEQDEASPFTQRSDYRD